MGKICIGIDPDLIKSGVATWNGKEFIQLGIMRFFELIDYLEFKKMEALMEGNEPDVKIYIEGGWLNVKSNFHKAQGASVREVIAKRVGENHAVGKLLVEYCELEMIPHHVIRPTQKKWDADVFKKITGVQSRTNPEIRDAARLVFGL